MAADVSSLIGYVVFLTSSAAPESEKYLVTHADDVDRNVELIVGKITPESPKYPGGSSYLTNHYTKRRNKHERTEQSTAYRQSG